MNEVAERKRELTSIRVIGECLAVIAELHPNWKYNETLTPKLWHDALKHYPVNIVKRAVLTKAQTSVYVPKLSEVLDEIEKTDHTHQNNAHLIDGESERIKRADKWWLSLTDKEMEESHQRQLDWIDGKDVKLNEHEKSRAILFHEVSQMIEEEKENA